MKLTKEQKMMLGVVALAGVTVILFNRKQKRERAAQGFSNAGGFLNVGGRPYSHTCAEGTNHAGKTFSEQGDRIHLLYNGDVKGWQNYICKHGKPIDFTTGATAGGGTGNLNAAIFRPKFEGAINQSTGAKDPCSNLSGNSLRDCCRTQGNSSLKCRSMSVSRKRVVRPSGGRRTLMK
jgi:hypothetical protein